jgi:hypothetical protein
MIPSKVKVAGIEYEVKEMEGINERFNVMGQVNYSQGSIEIDSGMCETRKQQTLVHEIMHTCFYDAGFEEQDEDMINRVSNVLYQVLKDNDLHFGNDVDKYFITTADGDKLTKETYDYIQKLREENEKRSQESHYSSAFYQIPFGKYKEMCEELELLREKVQEKSIVNVEIPLVLDGKEIAKLTYKDVTEMQERATRARKRFN